MLQRKFRTVFLLLLYTVVCCIQTASTQAQTAGDPSLFMTFYERAAEPKGFSTTYCASDSKRCLTGSLAQNLTVDGRTLDAIKAVNHAVNTEFEKLSIDPYSLSEKIAIEKATRLQQSVSIAPSNLLLTIVESKEREERMVLLVVTSWGEFVLDNENSNWLHWKQFGDVFKSRQSRTIPTQWWSLQKPNRFPPSKRVSSTRPLTAKPNEWVGDLLPVMPSFIS